MPGTQTQLRFPVRKSARRKTNIDKENPITSSSTTSHDTHVNSKVSIKHKAKSSLLHSGNELSDLIQQETTPNKLYQKAISPSKRSACRLSVVDSSPNKRRNQASCDVTPNLLSPSKRFNSNTSTDTRNQGSAKNSSRCLFDSPRKLLSPRKCDYTGSMGRNISTEGPRTSAKQKELSTAFDKENVESPRKLSKSPRKHSPVVKCSPKKYLSPRKMLSPRKLLSPPTEKCVEVPTPRVSKEALFSQTKYALNTQQPERVLCREKEMEQISSFLDDHISGERKGPGSLYISGAPGTGKTAVIKHLLEKKSQDIAQKVFINSMTVKSPFAMYKAIAVELMGSKAESVRNSKSACSMLHKYLTSPGKRVLLVLDEMDQLDSKNQEVLYTIFEWPSMAKSRLILIGIANALDLTDRILPRLNVRVECKPELLHFTPYTKEQILTVIESRLQQTPEMETSVLDKSALLFCARKVSAVAGDMRKALDICRRSVELAQLSGRKQDLLKLKGGMTSAPDSTASSTVGIMQVASVVDDVYGSTNSASKPSTFPLQQKLIVCTLLLMLKSSKLKELNLGKVHDAYSRVCRKRDVAPTDQSEFISLCHLLETRGLLSLKKAKEARLIKISLKLDAKELEFALKDKLLISSVLETGL